MKRLHWNGDDLGTVSCHYEGYGIGEAVLHSLANVYEGYKIVDVIVQKRYWIFGQLIIDIIQENPEKIDSLKGTQHYSKHYHER